MFKLNSPLVVLDLEATAAKDEKGNQTNNCIIDIGAVYLDENLEVQGEFSALVKPAEEISPFITKLTGISPAMVENEPAFDVVGKNFIDWITSLAGNVKKVRLAAWGNYFDIPLLRKNYQDAGLEYPFSGTAIDTKTLAILWLSHSGRRTDKISLEVLADLFGIKPVGAYHRALTDAKVTAEVLVKVWKDMGGFFVPVKDGEPYRHLSITVSKS